MTRATMWAWFAAAAFFLAAMFAMGGVAFGSDFDSAQRDLHYNYNFVNAHEDFNFPGLPYQTVIICREMGIGILIEQRTNSVRISIYSKAGDTNAARIARSWDVREFFPGGSRNIVSIGLHNTNLTVARSN